MHCSNKKTGKETMPTLPQEIIDEILYRLPAKTIGRFRCISKAWLAFLTQPHFILTHLKLSRKNPTHSLLSISKDHSIFSAPINNAHPAVVMSKYFDHLITRATKLTFPNDHPDYWMEIIASCDGLVLLVSHYGRQPQKEEEVGLKLWIINPTTKAMREVPPSPPTLGYQILKAKYGLGYDEVDDDYKVFKVSYYYAKKEDVRKCKGMLVGVFSLKSGEWRRLDASHNPYNVNAYVFPNGCIHFKATKIADNSSVIVAFSLRDEKFYEVPVTSALDGTKFKVKELGTQGAFSWLCDPMTVVWVMKEYGVKESWIKLTIPRPREEDYRPMCLLGEEQIVMTERINSRQLVIYDMEKQTMKDLLVNGIRWGLDIGLTYFESLVSPN